MSAPIRETSKRLILLLLSVHILLAAKDSIATDFYCFSGDLNNRNLLRNISCQPVVNTPITELSSASMPNNTFTTTSGPPFETIPPEIIDQNTTSNSDNWLTTTSGSHVTVSMGNSSNETSPIQISSHANNVTSCYILKYTVKTISVSLQELNIQAEFSCDFHGRCNGKSKNKRNPVTLDDGQEGDLYCCTTLGCNKPELLPDIPPRQQLCYQSLNETRQDEAQVSIVGCLMPNTACARKRSPSQSLLTAEYFCDNNYMCQHHELMNETASCKNITINNTVWELCCCTENKCYKPETESDALDGKQHLQGYQIGAIAGAVITALLILMVLICVLRKYVCHCGQNEADQGPVTMLYKRLAANIPDDTADVEMLLA